jgi:hypothetical protein
MKGDPANAEQDPPIVREPQAVFDDPERVVNVNGVT